MLVQTLEMALLLQIDVRWSAVVIFAPHIMEKTPAALVEFRTVTEMPAFARIRDLSEVSGWKQSFLIFVPPLR